MPPMDTDEQHALRQLTGDPGTPVPAVSVQDMKALWQAFQKTGSGTALGMGYVRLLCPDADHKALGFRCQNLMMLEHLGKLLGRPFEVTEGVFQVTAAMPLKYLEIGKPIDFTFDFDDFFAKVRAAEPNQ